MKKCPNCWGYQEYENKPQSSCACKQDNEKIKRVNPDYVWLGMILSK